jgi:hypothetical protein
MNISTKLLAFTNLDLQYLAFQMKARHSKSVVEKPPEITIFTGSLNDATAI